MYSKYPFPISMENIPRQKTFFCLSLRFASVFTALLVVIFTILSIAQSTAAIRYLRQESNQEEFTHIYLVLAGGILNDAVTLFLSALMLVGALKNSSKLIRPWVIWSSIQVIVFIILFVWATTMATIGHTTDVTAVGFIVQFLILMIEIYMLVLVASYYKQLVEDDEERDRIKSLVNHEFGYQLV